MRITHVRFKNLNSLVGEWVIDFTDPAYVCDGLFAIIGPTGAGKTTILDAICLALYGRTPRLDRVTKSTNEIMSRQRPDCFAEVTFETAAGTFRCHWSQARSRKGSASAFQPHKHELSDVATGQVQETHIRRVAERVVELTGMDFQQFTRSVLLAQGSFAAFLNASADERSALLEGLTGAGIYSELSILIHERRRDERVKLDQLGASLAGLAVLTSEELATLDTRLAQCLQEELQCQADLEKVRGALVTGQTINDLKASLEVIVHSLQSLDAESLAFEPELVQLQRASQAATLEGAYGALCELRQSQSRDQLALGEQQGALPGRSQAVADLASALEQAKLEAAAKREAYEQLKPLLIAMRSQDQRIATQRESVAELDARCVPIAGDIATKTAARAITANQRTTAQAQLDHITNYLDAQREDAWLTENLALVEDRAAAWHAKQQQLMQASADRSRLEQAWADRVAAHDAAIALVATRREALKGLDTVIQCSQADWDRLLGDRLLREIHAEKDGLMEKRALLGRIAALEDQRKTLRDGEACALCGATVHPYATGQVPTPDETDLRIAAVTALIQQADTLQLEMRTQESARHNTQLLLAEAENQRLAREAELNAASQALVDHDAAQERLQTECEGRLQALLDSLAPLGITTLAVDDLGDLLKSLRERRGLWLKRQEEHQECLKRLADLERELMLADGVLTTREQELKSRRDELARASATLNEWLHERMTRFGDRNPDSEELDASAAIAASEGAERQADAAHQEAVQSLVALKARIEAIERRLAQGDGELLEREVAFMRQLKATGFADEAGFHAAQRAPAVRDALAEKARELDERRVRLTQSERDVREHLAEAIRLMPEAIAMEELEAQQADCAARLSELQHDMAGIQQRLTSHRETLKQRDAQLARIDAQRRETARWDELYELVGSHDGKKFRNFAQGLTFDVMVQHANRQLRKMSDRYLLVRDHTEPLELNVIDAYQAGETRATRNLSGGESFLISLALALGLSHMASQKVRVESLFLDEGFGTLDEEALETALNTLGALQQTGRLIGIISHVGGLKERIATQVVVTPQTGGRSILSGPGCRRLNPT